MNSFDDTLMPEPSRGDGDAREQEMASRQLELEAQNAALRQKQTALEAARDYYADLFDFAPMAYLTLSGDGLIAEINHAAATLLGAARASVLNCPFARCIGAEDSARWSAHWARVLQGDVELTCEVALRRGDGLARQVRLDGVRCADDRQSPVVRVVMTDITERRQTELA